MSLKSQKMNIAGIPCHITQQSNKGRLIFFDSHDYYYYLKHLKAACERYQVFVHAYALLPDHVHLLLTPSTERGVSQVMQYLRKHHVGHNNDFFQHDEPLWENEYKSSLIQYDYVLTCYRYIELKPVSAGVVNHPNDYFWSSYRVHAKGEYSPIIVDHDAYMELGKTNAGRIKNYRRLFKDPLDTVLIAKLQYLLDLSEPLGDKRFRARVEEVARPHI